MQSRCTHISQGWEMCHPAEDSHQALPEAANRNRYWKPLESNAVVKKQLERRLGEFENVGTARVLVVPLQIFLSDHKA